MKTNNTPKINSHKASKIPKPLHLFPPAQSTPRDPGVSSVSGVSGVSSSLLDQKNACFWSKSEQKRCFMCSNHSKSGAKFHPPVGTCLGHVMEAPPQKHHTLYIYQRSLYRKGATTRPTQIGKRQRAHPERAHHPLWLLWLL